MSTNAGILDDDLRATSECRLSTVGRSSGLPREVRVWFAAVEDHLYLLAQDRKQAHWVRNVDADPAVSVRIEARTFRGRARLVESEPDDAAARGAIAAKYGTKWLTDWLRDSLPVRIDLEQEIT